MAIKHEVFQTRLGNLKLIKKEKFKSQPTIILIITIITIKVIKFIWIEKKYTFLKRSESKKHPEFIKNIKTSFNFAKKKDHPK